MLKQSKIILLLFLCLFLSPSISLAYDEEEVVSQFHQVAQQYIEEYNSNKEPIVTSDFGSLYYKCYVFASKEYSINVERTTSLTSPYVGTFTYTQFVYVSPNKYKTQEEAKADNAPLSAYKGTIIGDGKMTGLYAYQDGKWVMKRRPMA